MLPKRLMNANAEDVLEKVLTIKLTLSQEMLNKQKTMPKIEL